MLLTILTQAQALIISVPTITTATNGLKIAAVTTVTTAATATSTATTVATDAGTNSDIKTVTSTAATPTSTSTGTGTTSTGSSALPSWVIPVAAAGGAVLILTIIIIYCCRRKRNRKNKKGVDFGAKTTVEPKRNIANRMSTGIWQTFGSHNKPPLGGGRQMNTNRGYPLNVPQGQDTRYNPQGYPQRPYGAQVADARYAPAAYNPRQDMTAEYAVYESVEEKRMSDLPEPNDYSRMGYAAYPPPAPAAKQLPQTSSTNSIGEQGSEYSSDTHQFNSVYSDKTIPMNGKPKKGRNVASILRDFDSALETINSKKAH